LGAEFTKSKIDRLGDRLRQGSRSEDDLRMWDAFRRSFRTEYDMVMDAIRNQIHPELTGRPSKSTSAIREKLDRESIRLSQVQDIAGCRIVVEGIREQNEVITSFGVIFPDAKLFDRRLDPSHGYRAVHIIVHVNDKPIEVQIRSRLQHLWAEYSEKLADVSDPGIKYGGGSEEIRRLLQAYSELVEQFEKAQYMIVDIEDHQLDDHDREKFESLKADVNSKGQWVADAITNLIRESEHKGGHDDDFLN